LGYVWQKKQINDLGAQIKENENKLEDLRRENKRRGDTLAYLMSPQELDARLRQLGLDLEVPRPEQIVVLVDAKIEAASPLPIRTASR
jgi:predicted nuclease with TOPRIM domain